MRQIGVRVELTTRQLRDHQVHLYTEVEIHHNDPRAPRQFQGYAKTVAARLARVNKPSEQDIQEIIDQVLGKEPKGTPPPSATKPLRRRTR